MLGLAVAVALCVAFDDADAYADFDPVRVAPPNCGLRTNLFCSNKFSLSNGTCIMLLEPTSCL